MLNDMKKFLLAYLRKYAMHVVGALVGLIVAILFLTIGFFKTLLLAICIAAGVFCGAFFSKRTIIIQKLTDIFEDDY